ncbi:MAG: hypothetical protein ACE5NL_01285 [Candidatus Hydrothermarchaeaceae archaeon]
MAVVGIGERMVMMQGFARQKAISTKARKRARAIAFRRYVVPSETKESLPARICLSEAAQKAYGKSFEDVIARVQADCSGKDYGGEAKRKRLRTGAHKAATANIARMKAKLAAL